MNFLGGKKETMVALCVPICLWGIPVLHTSLLFNNASFVPTSSGAAIGWNMYDLKIVGRYH